ncbi:Glyoxalase family protein [Chitinispirillum alkaliphilum]|nr:Glyoxalase family protein [Chitinispirillum alkaliphilum]
MTKKAEKAVPEGYNTVTAYLNFNGGCKEAIEYYKKAFGATLPMPVMESPDGRVMHTVIKIGDSNIMMSDNFEQNRAVVGDAIHLWIYVEDCDTTFKNAIEAGGKVTMEMEDQFWGDRLGQIQDPFGIRWSIASYKWEVSPEEMGEKQKAWFKSIGLD